MKKRPKDIETGRHRNEEEQETRKIITFCNDLEQQVLKGKQKNKSKENAESLRKVKKYRDQSRTGREREKKVGDIERQYTYI